MLLNYQSGKVGKAAKRQGRQSGKVGKAAKAAMLSKGNGNAGQWQWQYRAMAMAKQGNAAQTHDEAVASMAIITSPTSAQVCLCQLKQPSTVFKLIIVFLNTS
jgi:hypothetical protein